jgi:hypothetical protein
MIDWRDWAAGYGLIVLYMVIPGIVLGTIIHILRHL